MRGLLDWIIGTLIGCAVVLLIVGLTRVLS